MEFTEYIIENVKHENNEVFILIVKPKNGESIFSFLPGQFAQIRNPLYQSASRRTDEAHLFSIASSPNAKDHLELCIKVYGFWTQALSKLKTGDSLFIRGPFGKFVWNSSLKNAVFLIGGVAITPIMSMLRLINEKKQNSNLTLIYGNRTENSIAYKYELEQLQSTLANFKIVHVLSDIKPKDQCVGYRGFITEDILQKEVDLSTKPTFFLCGPPIFIEKMKSLLRNLYVQETRIKQELF